MAISGMRGSTSNAIRDARTTSNARLMDDLHHGLIAQCTDLSASVVPSPGLTTRIGVRVLAVCITCADYS